MPTDAYNAVIAALQAEQRRMRAWGRMQVDDGVRVRADADRRMAWATLDTFDEGAILRAIRRRSYGTVRELAEIMGWPFSRTYAALKTLDRAFSANGDPGVLFAHEDGLPRYDLGEGRRSCAFQRPSPPGGRLSRQ